jgi:peptidyl-tRNA hydrolase
MIATGNPMLAHLDERALRDPLSVYLIINGPLNMSTGKIAAQAFQAAQRLFARAQDPDASPEHAQALAEWLAEGTCTITRVAETDVVFERARQELDCVEMVDEGLTEVQPGSCTMLAVGPIRRSQEPRMLRHKRCRLMRD